MVGEVGVDALAMELMHHRVDDDDALQLASARMGEGGAVGQVTEEQSVGPRVQHVGALADAVAEGDWSLDSPLGVAARVDCASVPAEPRRWWQRECGVIYRGRRGAGSQASVGVAARSIAGSLTLDESLAIAGSLALRTLEVALRLTPATERCMIR